MIAAGSMRALHLPPTYQDSVQSGRVILRDGSTAFIRLAQPADRDALREFFHQLSPESKRRRFFSSANPPDALVARLCDSSNPRSQLSLIVNRTVAGVSRIIATGSYSARDGSTAEVAFAVDDEFQGKGLGGLLLERLALLAARHGFVRFWALTRIENRLMLDTFRNSGFRLHEKVEDECVEIDFAVAPSEESVSHSEIRDRVFTAASLHPFFRPRAVAVIGASRDPSSIGYRILAALRAGSFAGPIYAVNPNAARIDSTPVYSSAREIPSGADLAILVIPRDGVLSAVDDCAAAGIRALLIVSAGFAEAGAEGRALQEKLVDKVRGLGMRVVGPNSMGLVNADPDIRLNASVSATLPLRGGVAMSSQSGALGLAMLALAQQRDVGISTFVSVGNKADISGNDLLQYWLEDAATRVILLYLESFGNPRRFARIARGVSLSKPIVAVTAGHRAAGSEAAAPFEGDAPVDALFRQTGVIRAETLDEMFDLAAALDRQPLPAGRRVGIVSDGGGPGLLCASACEAAGLSVLPLSAPMRERLRTLLPPSVAIGNPLELVFPPSPEPFARAIETLLSAGETDAVIAIHTPFVSNGSAEMLEAIRRGVTDGRAAGGAGKPVLACLVARPEAGRPLQAVGESIPTYAFPGSAARALGRIATYADWHRGPHGIVPDFDDIAPASARAICRRAIAERGPGWLLPEETRAVLDAMHLPLVPAGGGPGAGETSSEREAGRRTDGFEVKVCMLEDPSFGPLIAFGLSGNDIEVIAGLSVRVTPLTDRAAAAMVRQNRGHALLEGYRGRAPADIGAIQELLLRVSRLVEEVPDVAELELNPVVVGSPGEGCRIVEARIRAALPVEGHAARYTTSPAIVRSAAEVPRRGPGYDLGRSNS
jgi:acyl-CoA synthetase (NDP forming)/RimJ/RimL family protein N-acetyltransferase